MDEIVQKSNGDANTIKSADLIAGISSLNPSFCTQSLPYLYAFMKAHQKELEKKREGSTNQQELKPLTLKEMLVPIPPLSEQKRISEAIKNAIKYLATIEKSLN